MLAPTSAAARTVGKVLALITAVVLFAFVPTGGVHRLTPVPAWKECVDIGAEGNLPTWWNTTLLALVGAGALVAAALDADHRPSMRAWLVVAAAGAYLSLDEAAGLHERLNGLTARAGIDPPTYAWVLPGALLAGVGATVLIVIGRRLPSPTGLRLGVALGAYGTGAIAVEAFTGAIRDDGVGWLYGIGIAVEETLEMGAAAYAVTTIVDHYGIQRVANGFVLAGRGGMAAASSA